LIASLGINKVDVLFVGSESWITSWLHY